LYHWGYSSNNSLIATNTSTGNGAPVASCTADVQLITHGGDYDETNLCRFDRDGTAFTGGHNAQGSNADGGLGSYIGWKIPKFPGSQTVEMQGNLICAVARGTAAEDAQDWLLTDGTFLTNGYSGTYGQASYDNGRRILPHTVGW
jgi:hypothetical protein